MPQCSKLQARSRYWLVVKELEKQKPRASEPAGLPGQETLGEGDEGGRFLS
jgi:hypothetical protein